MFCSKTPLDPVAGRNWCQLLLLVVMLVTSGVVIAQDDAPRMEIWLVTYGPGEISWQRFGHNAIWVRDKSSRLDHVFNFGFFDFEQEAFYRRFLQGKLLYFSAAQPAEREFSGYINENRSIRAQRLDLSEEQALTLAEYLLGEIQPENRDYLYDYYVNNCSTRIRDALDLALGGALAASYKPEMASQSWRDHTRRLTAPDFWLYLGLEVGLGGDIDRQNSRWEEFFIPSELTKAIAEFQIESNAGRKPLVIEDVMLYESTLEPPPQETANWWVRYVLVSAFILVLAWVACRIIPFITAHKLARAWLVLAGLGGGLLTFFWFFTDHQAAQRNINLLLLNPVWIIFAFWRQPRISGWLLIGLSMVALIWGLIPGGQYNLDVLALLLPLNTVAGLALLKASRA